MEKCSDKMYRLLLYFSAFHDIDLFQGEIVEFVDKMTDFTHQRRWNWIFSFYDFGTN
ncbi:MAG: hypothetical protein Q7T72_14155 [Bacteroidales bacterium]|nr:hypothetical protein [Bacteroidales bacterium]